MEHETVELEVLEEGQMDEDNMTCCWSGVTRIF